MVPYYINRYGWTYNISISIHWNSIQMANRKLQYHSFYTKLAQGIIPTRYFLNRYNKSESPICPSCHSAIETNEHLFQCICCSPWRKKLYKSIGGFCKKTRLGDTFTGVLLTYIKSYCNGTNYMNKSKESFIDLLIYLTSIRKKLSSIFY